MVFIFVVQWDTFFCLGTGGRNQLMGSLLGSKEDVSFEIFGIAQMLQISIEITVEDSRNSEEAFQGCPYPLQGKLFCRCMLYCKQKRLFLFASVDIDMVNVINRYI